MATSGRRALRASTWSFSSGSMRALRGAGAASGPGNFDHLNVNRDNYCNGFVRKRSIVFLCLRVAHALEQIRDVLGRHDLYGGLGVGRGCRTEVRDAAVALAREIIRALEASDDYRELQLLEETARANLSRIPGRVRSWMYDSEAPPSP